jgi:hypothetical protein
VTIFEALHDMSRPVDALRAARRMLSDDGTLLVADGRVADEFTVPASTLERYAYGWSVVFSQIHTDFWRFYRLLR